jgi:hypothetical protein
VRKSFPGDKDMLDTFRHFERWMSWRFAPESAEVDTYDYKKAAGDERSGDWFLVKPCGQSDCDDRDQDHHVRRARRGPLLNHENVEKKHDHRSDNGDIDQCYPSFR